MLLVSLKACKNAQTTFVNYIKQYIVCIFPRNHVDCIIMEHHATRSQKKKLDDGGSISKSKVL